MSRKYNKNICRIPKFEIEEILSLSELKQQLGWGLSAFKIPEIWNITQGEGVKIGLVDSGVQCSHHDLVDNVLTGINLVQKGKIPEDDNSHGTAAAGIIVAENNDVGIVGVAPKAKIIPIKVLDHNGAGDLGVVAEGVRWAVNNGADIISMSLGSPRPVPIIYKAIQYAESKGIPVFCAAGNSGNTRALFYPANYKETISIGSIDENFNRSSFSNTGDNLDFMAPGGKVFSTVPDNWYAYVSGTSFAAPFVAGLAALCLSYQRIHSPDKPLIGSQAYRDLFKSYTMPINDINYANKAFFQGFGIIDARELKNWIIGV